MRIQASILLAALIPALALAQGATVLAAEFRAESSPDPAGGPSPLTPDATRERLLDEARWSFAGMVWGFRFSYTPYDAERAVAEAFELEALGEVPWGDTALRVVDLAYADGTLRARIEFDCAGSRAAALSSWRTADFKPASGQGRARVSGGVERRRAAVEDAVVEALRGLLRPIVLEKPRSVRGILAFAEAPRVVITEGDYVAVVRLRVKVEEILAYPTY